MSRFDDIKDNGLLSSKVEDAKRARDDRMQQKSVGEVRVLDRIKQQEQEIDRIMNDANTRYEKKLEQVTSLGAKIDELRKVASRLDTARSYSSEKTFRQSIKSAISPRSQTEAITGVARSTQNLGTAVSMAQSTSTFQLEQDRARASSLMARNNSRILAAEADQDQPGGAARLDMAVRVQDKLVMQAGMADAAINAQKKMGIDTRSTFFNAQQSISRVQDQQGQSRIREDVAAGRVGSRSQVQEELDQAAKDLITTFSKLSEAVNSNSEDAKELGEEFRDLEGAYKKHQQTLREIDRISGGGRGSLSAAGGVVSDLGVMTQGAAQIYKTNMITSEMQQTQNRQGYAELSNQRFEDVYGAGKGDMAALRRIMSDQYSDQAARGAEYRDRGQFAKGLETTGVGMKGTGTLMDQFDPGEKGLGNVWEGIKGFFTKGGGVGAVVQTGAQIGAKMTPDAVQFNENLTDYRKDIQAGQSDINAQRQYRSYQDEKFKVRDFAAQKGMDYYKQLTLATRGLGPGGGAASTEVERLIGTGRELIGDELDTQVDKSAHGGIVDVLNAGATRQMAGKGQGYSEAEKQFIRSSVNPEALARLKAKMGVKTTEPSFYKAKEFIKSHEGLSLDAYKDTERGYSIGYGHFEAGTGQKGKSITAEQAGALFDKDFTSHGNQVDNMLGQDTVSKLNEAQRGALYSMAYNAGPGSLNYGGNNSIKNRLQRGDIAGAGQQMLSTAVTSDGSVNPALVRRREEEYKMFSGQEIVPNLPSKRPSPYETKIVNGKEMRVVKGLEGGGGDRETAMAALMDPDVLKRLSEESGIGVGAIPGLVSDFKGAIGKEFTSKSGLGVEGNLAAAGRAARAGYVDSPGQYASMRGMLTSVGGDAADLEKIMKQAVASGMDSSKNIMEMVGAVQQLGSVSAGYGIDTARATGNMIGASVQGLRASGVSKNMATKAAQQGMNAVEGFGTSSDFDVFNMMEFAGLREDFTGAKMYELEALQTASPAQLNELLRLQKSGEMNPETGKTKAEELATQMGIGGVLTNQEQTQKAINRTQQQVVRRTMGLGYNQELEQSIMSKVGNTDFKDLTFDEQNFFNARAKQTGKASGAAMWSGLNSETAEGILRKGPQGRVTGGGEAAVGAEGVVDAKVFMDATRLLAKASQNLIDLGHTTEATAGATNAEDIFEQTQKAAAAMQGPINQFSDKMIAPLNKSVGEFTKKMEGLIDKMNGALKQQDINPLPQGRKK